MSLPTKPKKKLAQTGVLCDFLGVDPKDLLKYSRKEYEWNGNYYEVVGDKEAREKHKSGGTPISHYITYSWGGKDWRIRELGEKSQFVQQLKKG